MLFLIPDPSQLENYRVFRIGTGCGSRIRILGPGICPAEHEGPQGRIERIVCGQAYAFGSGPADEVLISNLVSDGTSPFLGYYLYSDFVPVCHLVSPYYVFLNL